MLFATQVSALTKVVSSIDKNPVIANESFVLTVTADDDVDADALDTSALLNDFIVGRTSVSSQTSMINFNTTRTTTWTTVLIAKQEGDYTIPSFTIEGKQTNPIQVKVLSAQDAGADTQQDIFITTEISANEVYVQQQVTLSVKLHFAAELKRGSLTEPELIGASIAQIGKDIESEAIINGKRYRVIERTYAISPQQSGKYIVKSPMFSGEIMKPSTRRNSFLSFAETKPVSVIGDDIALNVKPIPANYQGTWLPSELLALHQEWQPDVNELKVGEPITRVITLTAAGLSKEQLPEIDMPMPDGLKVYPDQAELHSGINNNRLVSQKVRNFAVVASKAGQFTLPEIRIPWWNTKTNRQEIATIPAQTITVKENPAAPSTPSAQPQTQQVNVQPPGPATQIIVEKAHWLQWLFLALWLLTCFAWWLSAYLKKPKNKPKAVSPSDAYLALLAAAKKNQPQQVLELICPWYQQLTGRQTSTLNQVTKALKDPQFEQAISALQQVCFGKEQATWDNSEFLTLIQEIQKRQSQRGKDNKPNLQLNPL